MSIVEETIKPEEIRRLLSEKEDESFALNLQNNEYTNLTKNNVLRSKERSNDLVSGYNSANSFAAHEKALDTIIQTEFKKREEMDKTLAEGFQDKELAQTLQEKEMLGIRAWHARELIGFKHQQARIKEMKTKGLTDINCDEFNDRMIQALEDQALADSLQQKEDSEFAHTLEKKIEAEDQDLMLAKRLTNESIDDTNANSAEHKVCKPNLNDPSFRSNAQLLKSHSLCIKSQPEHPFIADANAVESKATQSLSRRSNTVFSQPVKNEIGNSSQLSCHTPWSSTDSHPKLFSCHSNPDDKQGSSSETYRTLNTSDAYYKLPNPAEKRCIKVSGVVPKEGHPFMQTSSDRTLFQMRNNPNFNESHINELDDSSPIPPPPFSGKIKSGKKTKLK